LILGSVAAATVLLATVHRLPVQGEGSATFTVDVPDGWGFVEDGFTVAHYRDVRFAVNNRGDDGLRVLDGRREKIGSVDDPYPVPDMFYNAEAFARQIDPGTVYVDVATWGGPSPIRDPCVSAGPYSPSPDVPASLDGLEPRWKFEDVSVYAIGFCRWAWGWDVRIATREPFDRADLAGALDVARSLRFPRAPVLDRYQAVEVSLPEAPPEVRPPPGWFEGTCRPDTHRILSEPQGENGFLVEIGVLDGTPDEDVIREFRCLVTREGTVEVLP